MLKYVKYYLFTIIVTFFYCGKIKKAPGTCASLIALIVWIFFTMNNLHFIFWIFAIIILSIISIFAIRAYIEDLEEKDDKSIVIDEVLGQWTSLLLIYPFYKNYTDFNFIFYCIISFISFRAFDILKPSVIGSIDKNMKNEFGIVLDDIVSGVASALVSAISLLLINIFL
jgi:phosphatidylglycerophosphatase A